MEGAVGVEIWIGKPAFRLLGDETDLPLVGV
jgi:hypothetical protein